MTSRAATEPVDIGTASNPANGNRIWSRLPMRNQEQTFVFRTISKISTAGEEEEG